MQELHAELASRSSMVVRLQSELQSRQFEMQSLLTQHSSTSASEAQERIRLATELGQSRVLAQARARQLEAALEASERQQAKLNNTIASESVRYLSAMDQIQSLKSDIITKETRWVEEREVLREKCKSIHADKEAAVARSLRFESEASELKSKSLKLEAVIKDQELQVRNDPIPLPCHT
jgi:predicted  nucleic acid-binding Zn-ribbon protein